MILTNSPQKWKSNWFHRRRVLVHFHARIHYEVVYFEHVEHWILAAVSFIGVPTHSISTIHSVRFLKRDNVLTTENASLNPKLRGRFFLIFLATYFTATFFPQATKNVCLINRASSYSELLAKRTHLFPLRLSFNTLLYRRSQSLNLTFKSHLCPLAENGGVHVLVFLISKIHFILLTNSSPMPSGEQQQFNLFIAKYHSLTWILTF